MEAYSNLHDWVEAVRELANGGWTFLNAGLFIVFTWYSWYWVKKVRWPWDRVTQGAIGLSIYFFGSTIRAAYLWLQWISISHDLDLDFWKGPQTEIIIALILCIIGSAISVKVFVSDGYGKLSAFLIVLFAVVIPVVVHFFASSIFRFFL
jgi:hypothetical protein